MGRLVGHAAAPLQVARQRRTVHSNALVKIDKHYKEETARRRKLIAGLNAEIAQLEKAEGMPER